jgi:hypothetical protein
MAHHVALLGDSIFDNSSYTRGEPDVVEHLRQLLPKPWQATLLAVDGATTLGLPAQVKRIPDGVSHLAVSIGGNDALGNLDMLNARATSSEDALFLFEERIARFEQRYRDALELVRARKLPTTVCTIYNGNLPEPREARKARMALMMFNDVIARTAYDYGFDLVELRVVCSEPSDYANPIEPSGSGGRKIARILASAIGAVTGSPRSRTFV